MLLRRAGQSAGRQLLTELDHAAAVKLRSRGGSAYRDLNHLASQRLQCRGLVDPLLEDRHPCDKLQTSIEPDGPRGRDQHIPSLNLHVLVHHATAIDGKGDVLFGQLQPTRRLATCIGRAGSSTQVSDLGHQSQKLIGKRPRTDVGAMDIQPALDRLAKRLGRINFRAIDIERQISLDTRHIGQQGSDELEPALAHLPGDRYVLDDALLRLAKNHRLGGQIAIEIPSQYTLGYGELGFGCKATVLDDQRDIRVTDIDPDHIGAVPADARTGRERLGPFAIRRAHPGDFQGLRFLAARSEHPSGIGSKPLGGSGRIVSHATLGLDDRRIGLLGHLRSTPIGEPFGLQKDLRQLQLAIGESIRTVDGHDRLRFLPKNALGTGGRCGTDELIRIAGLERRLQNAQVFGLRDQMPSDVIRIERPVHLTGEVSSDANRRRGRSGRSGRSNASSRFGLQRRDQSARVDPKCRLALAACVARVGLVLRLDGKRIGPDQKIIDLKIRQLAAVEFPLKLSHHARFLQGGRAAG